MAEKTKELKQVYIPYTNVEEPVTGQDKTSIVAEIRSFTLCNINRAGKINKLILELKRICYGRCFSLHT